MNRGHEPDPAAVAFDPRELVQIDRIQAAIRERIARRRRDETPVDFEDFKQARERRIEPLRDWNFPEAIWRAMWPPHLEPWNLEQDFAIESHRGAIGATVVLVKRVQRAILRVVLRPLLTQQVEINRSLALITRTLTDELTAERLRVRRLEAKVARISAVARELHDPKPVVRILEDGECG